MIKQIIKRIFNLSKSKIIKYKIGNVKIHNAFIDVLTPQFVEIGDNFISAPGAIVLSHDASLFNKNGLYRVEKTIIGNNVFLGAYVIVLPGVKIGDNVIVGAGSVVTKNIEDNTVVAGNPARPICTVEDYYEKCKKKNCLYEPPASFRENWKKRKINNSEFDEFQRKITDEYKNRTSIE